MGKERIGVIRRGWRMGWGRWLRWLWPRARPPFQGEGAVGAALRLQSLQWTLTADDDKLVFGHNILMSFERWPEESWGLVPAAHRTKGTGAKEWATVLACSARVGQEVAIRAGKICQSTKDYSRWKDCHDRVGWHCQLTHSLTRLPCLSPPFPPSFHITFLSISCAAIFRCIFAKWALQKWPATLLYLQVCQIKPHFDKNLNHCVDKLWNSQWWYVVSEFLQTIFSN